MTTGYEIINNEEGLPNFLLRNKTTLILIGIGVVVVLIFLKKMKRAKK